MKAKTNLIAIFAITLALAGCNSRPTAVFVGGEYVFHTWSWTVDGEKVWRFLSSAEPLAVFEYGGEIRIFDNRAKTVYRTKSPRAFLLRVAELHRAYDFDFIPIFELCGYFETPLIDKALASRLVSYASHTKDEENSYATFDIDGEKVTFAGGLSWSFCTCGSDGWNWNEITEK